MITIKLESEALFIKSDSRARRTAGGKSGAE
jgi:hypothetical protein